MHAQLLSHVQLFATLCSIVHQALLSMGYPKQEYWSGLPFPPPRDLSNLGIKLTSSALADRFFFFFFLTTELPGKPIIILTRALWLSDKYGLLLIIFTAHTSSVADKKDTDCLHE